MKLPQKKKQYLRVRLTAEMLEALRKLADRDRRTVSDFVRLVLEGVIKKGARS